MFKPIWFGRSNVNIFGCGSKVRSWGYAGFSLWLHLPVPLFRATAIYLILTQWCDPCSKPSCSMSEPRLHRRRSRAEARLRMRPGSAGTELSPGAYYVVAYGYGAKLNHYSNISLGGISHPEFRSTLMSKSGWLFHMAMGQKPCYPPVNIPIPTKIGSKLGGAPTPIGFDAQPYGYGSKLNDQATDRRF